MRSRGRVGLMDLGEALRTPNVSLLMAEGGEGGEVDREQNGLVLSVRVGRCWRAFVCCAAGVSVCGRDSVMRSDGTSETDI